MHFSDFIVDHIERLINNEFSLASTAGQERVREFKTNSSEISSLISNQKGLFNKLLTVTVSEKEDKKIWKAYDTVNEGAIIAVTIGFPVVIIGAVEALPLVYSFGQSALPTVGKELGKAFAVNKGKVALLNGFSNLGEQYLSTGIAESKWGKQNWGQIDLFDVGASAAFGNFGSVPLKSGLNYTIEGGPNLSSLEDFSKNMLFNSLKFKASNSFGTAVGKPLMELSKPIGSVFDFGGKVTIKTTISSAKKNAN